MKILCAMSGGVDSSVAAWLLKQQGHEVIGVFMRNGIEYHRSNQNSCCSLEDAYDARRVADQLGIPFYSVNLKDGFQKIIDYFIDEYNRGRTPNPCILCNRWLKFGALFDYARALGCRKVATGHYARVTEESGRMVLKRGVDASKDQSYVLSLLTQEQLEHTVLPLGDLTKDQVRSLAERAGLRTCRKPDSQEICFVPNNDYRKLLRPSDLRPGEIRTTDGRVVGRHAGLQLYTIGQRKGLGAHGKRMYVVELDPERNAVIVGEDAALHRSGMLVERINWLAAAEAVPGRLFRGEVKIRHTHAPAAASIEVLDDERARVLFYEPQRAITPGQAAAFYARDVVLGGGWIAAACSGDPVLAAAFEANLTDPCSENR